MTSEERRRQHGDRKRLGELKREQQKESKKRKVLKLEDSVRFYSYILQCTFIIGDVVVVIVRCLDLELPVQWVSITTKDVSSSCAHCKCTIHNVIKLSVTCGRSMVFSVYSGFLHQWNWLPRYSWNIVGSGVKHYNF